MHDFYSIIYLSSSAGGKSGGAGACERHSNPLMIAPAIHSSAELIACYRLSPGTGAKFGRFCDHLFVLFLNVDNKIVTFKNRSVNIMIPCKFKELTYKESHRYGCT